MREHTRNTAKSAEEEPPSEGHTFRFTTEVRSSSRVVGDPEYHDAPGFDGIPLVFEVRAWSLIDALEKAHDLPFSVLMRSLIEAEDETPAASTQLP